MSSEQPTMNQSDDDISARRARMVEAGSECIELLTKLRETMNAHRAGQKPNWAELPSSSTSPLDNISQDVPRASKPTPGVPLAQVHGVGSSQGTCREQTSGPSMCFSGSGSVYDAPGPRPIHPRVYRADVYGRPFPGNCQGQPVASSSNRYAPNHSDHIPRSGSADPRMSSTEPLDDVHRGRREQTGVSNAGPRSRPAVPTISEDPPPGAVRREHERLSQLAHCVPQRAAPVVPVPRPPQKGGSAFGAVGDGRPTPTPRAGVAAAVAPSPISAFQQHAESSSPAFSLATTVLVVSTDDSGSDSDSTSDADSSAAEESSAEESTSEEEEEDKDEQEDAGNTRYTITSDTTLQDVCARRKEIKKRYKQKKAEIVEAYDNRAQSVRNTPWRDGPMKTLRWKKYGVMEELITRREIEKKWTEEEEEEKEEDDEEDEEWVDWKADRAIHRLETRRLHLEWKGLLFRVQVQEDNIQARLAKIEEKKIEALYDLEMSYMRDMEAWTAMRREYTRRLMGE